MALVALRDVAEARQMARVAEEAGVAREALYRMPRRSGNPLSVASWESPLIPHFSLDFHPN